MNGGREAIILSGLDQHMIGTPPTFSARISPEDLEHVGGADAVRNHLMENGYSLGDLEEEDGEILVDGTYKGVK